MKSAACQVTCPNQVWIAEITTLDMLDDEPFLIIVGDAYSRFILAAAPIAGANEHVVAELDHAGKQIGYPEEIWIDPGFEFSTPALKEWGAQRRVEIVYGQTSTR